MPIRETQVFANLIHPVHLPFNGLKFPNAFSKQAVPGSFNLGSPRMIELGPLKFDVLIGTYQNATAPEANPHVTFLLRLLLLVLSQYVLGMARSLPICPIIGIGFVYSSYKHCIVNAFKL